MFYKTISPKLFKIFLIISLLALLSFLYLYFIFAEKLDINFLKIDDMRVVERYEKTNKYSNTLYKLDGLSIKIEETRVGNESEGENNRRFRIQRMKALFENAASPYPGELSDEIACGDKYRPKLSSVNSGNLKIDYFTGYLNNRLQFGACTDDQAVNKGIVAYFYCQKTKAFFQFEIISDVKYFDSNTDSIQTILKSLSCK